MDEWIVGSSPHSGRTYVVHTKQPRFIVEMVDLGARERTTGALSWIDDHGTESALQWSKQALDVYVSSIEMGRGA